MFYEDFEKIKLQKKCQGLHIFRPITLTLKTAEQYTCLQFSPAFKFLIAETNEKHIYYLLVYKLMWLEMNYAPFSEEAVLLNTKSGVCVSLEETEKRISARIKPVLVGIDQLECQIVYAVEYKVQLYQYMPALFQQATQLTQLSRGLDPTLTHRLL